MWSLACMTFEMLTGELLFNPRKDQNENFGKNDDHLAQMMELLGRFQESSQFEVQKQENTSRKKAVLPVSQNFKIGALRML